MASTTNYANHATDNLLSADAHCIPGAHEGAGWVLVVPDHGLELTDPISRPRVWDQGTVNCAERKLQFVGYGRPESGSITGDLCAGADSELILPPLGVSGQRGKSKASILVGVGWSGCGDDEVDDVLGEAFGHRLSQGEGALEHGADDDVKRELGVATGWEVSSVDASLDGVCG